MMRQEYRCPNSSRIAALSVIAALGWFSSAHGTPSHLEQRAVGANASTDPPRVDCSPEKLLRDLGLRAGIEADRGLCVAATGRSSIQDGASARARRLAFESAWLATAGEIARFFGEEFVRAPDGRTVATPSKLGIARGNIEVLAMCTGRAEGHEVTCTLAGGLGIDPSCDLLVFTDRPVTIRDLQTVADAELLKILGVRITRDDGGRPMLVSFGQSDSGDDAVGASAAVRAKAVAAQQLIGRCVRHGLFAIRTSEELPGGGQRVMEELSWSGVRLQVSAVSDAQGSIRTTSLLGPLDWQTSEITDRGASAGRHIQGGPVLAGWTLALEDLRVLEERGVLRTIREWSRVDPWSSREVHGAIMGILLEDLRRLESPAAMLPPPDSASE